jgi:tRNA pseudouridine55 synthase
MINFEQGYVLSIDKPYAWTSTDVVRKIKILLRNKAGIKKIKVGHAGTLDPLATGVLIVCLGKATKNIETIQSGEKEYIANVYLGATTPSFDLETEIDNQYPVEHINEDLIKSVLLSFLGKQEQIPPLFSAKLIDGKRAYEYARAGKALEMKPANIEIYNLELLDYTVPIAKIKINCSKGTYIRSFARDLGLALQSGGYLSKLRRTASGEYNVANALTISEVETMFALDELRTPNM